MKRTLSLAALALSMVFGTAALTRAEDAPAAKGTVTGTVVDKDGKALANVSVRILVAPELGGKKKLAAEDKPAGDAPKPGERRKAIAEAKTGADGKFSVEVPAGHYIVTANERGVGAGREKADVEAGKTVDVKITIEPRVKKAA